MEHRNAFCEEIIKNVYLGQPASPQKGQDCFLDFYINMALSITEGYRLILETENYYISIQHNGVRTMKKTGPVSSITKPGELIEPYHSREDYEHVLFVGERLLSVKREKKRTCLKFINFTLLVFPCGDNEEQWVYHRPIIAYKKLPGSERYLQKCACGGETGLFLDSREDYFVCCPICRLGTFSTPLVRDAIEEWNNKANLRVVGEFPKDTFEKVLHEPVSFIAVSKRYWTWDDNVADSESIIMKIGGKHFLIRSGYVGEGVYDFVYEIVDNFNPDLWPHMIRASETEPINFVRAEIEMEPVKQLRFNWGSRPLVLTADDDGVIVGLIHYDEQGYRLDYENDTLFPAG